MIYYSGAAKPEERQDIPGLSLGGYKSSSLIPNGELHNVFPKITQQTVLENRKIMRLIVFRNEMPNPLTNVKIWTDNGEYSNILLAAVAPMFDEKCGYYSFEKIHSETSVPYQGTLMQYTEQAPIEIASVVSGQLVGIWIQKILDLDKFNDIDKGIEPIGELSDEYLKLLKSYQEQTQIFEDKFLLNIDWD